MELSSALKSEEELKSFWFVLDQGQLVPIEQYKFKKEQQNLKKLADYEIAKNRKVTEKPPHIDLMKKLGIADNEPASDSGNMRFYPKGRLLKALLEQYISKRVARYGGIEVETPIMYDAKNPLTASYFNRFPARQYNIDSDQNKKLFLRFSADFGQFLMAKDFQISYKSMPLKLYELTRYSFRREKHGELVGLRRLRAFTMPDCHAFCKDMVQAKEQFLERLELSMDVLEKIGISTKNDIEMALRFTEDFYYKNQEFIDKLASKFNRPVIVEMWKERFFYFVLKWEFNFIDNSDKAAALSTDQIDIENGNRYKIEFMDDDGTKKNPIILHNSPSGAIERIIYALLEKSHRNSIQGNVPQIPLWLCHTQIRLIPINENFVSFCEKLASEIMDQIRIDIDDRDESVNKKIRSAEKEWIPFIIVIGEHEQKTNIYRIRDRAQRKEYETGLKEIVNQITNQTKDMIFLPLNLPICLSRRPQIMA